MWVEIKVELDDATETVKTVFCTQLGQAELSQIMLFNVEINTDVDIERDDYKTSILCDENNPKSSILHRLLEKAPHYSIAYVDESIKRIQRQFSFDDISICDAFNEISEEIGCLFVYNSDSQTGGKPNRTISVYDLQQNCNNKDCKHRGEFTDKCPKCGSTDITYGYGDDTTIFVTSDELATEGIQLVTDTNLVKNCFKLEAGDDLMTATIRNCNPNGSDYIWYFSNSMKEDMSKELVDGIEGYDKKYREYYNNHISKLDETLIDKYNTLVEKYKEYYDTTSTCLDCGKEGYFEEQCTNTNCNSKNILVGQKLQTIPSTITGYAALMTAYYNTIDLLLYLKSGLMPNVKMSDTKAEDQIKLLTTATLSPVAVNVKEIKNVSEATAKSSVLSMAKVLIRPTYKVDVVDGSSSLSEYNSASEYRTWTGKFVVTNYSDEKDTATSDTISVRINIDTETFIKQKLDKALNKENTDDYSISGLFENEYDDFCNELKKYALNLLVNFSKACDTCLSILHEQGASDKDKKPDLYENLYKPYFDKQQAINNEIKIRENEISIIEGVWDKSDENNPECTTFGLQQYIEKCQKDIQKELDFEKYLGENLWLEFCSYRREDKYSNDNYISDGLNNAELFQKANEFIEVAEEEIFKSAELQHSISTTLNNLLAIPKFKPLIKYFKTGNWIRVQVDDNVYKLRLLKYEFRYGDFNTIPVEFSDVTKIKNGITDIKDVLEQASSMATSYDSVQRQAKKGNVARGTIDQWIVDGLDSANVRIKSNNNEEILLTKSGLLARSYDDITDTYSLEQFKITHNIMAYTTDGWETVSSALGKHKYKYWKDDSFIEDEGYGLTSKFVTAGYIAGSQMIGGEIISSNYELNKTGTYINLLNGNFDFAGGKIVFDADKDILTLKKVTIEWANTNAPKVTDISDLSDYLDDIDKDISDAEKETKNYADSKIKDLDNAVAKHLGIVGTTIIDEKAVISPYLGGGYLNIANTSDDVRVIIDPNNYTKNNYIFQVYNGSEISVGITSDGNAEFNGVIKAKKGGTIAGFNIGDTSIYNGTNTLTSTESGIYLGTDGIRQYESEEASVTISNGVLTANGANISGEITATSGTFTNCIIDDTCTIKGKLAIGNLPDDVATEDDIPTSTSELTNDSDYQNTTGVVEIAKGTITADFIKTLGLEVGNQIKMGSDATITWNNVDNKPSNLATTDDIPTDDYITTISKNAITSEYIKGLNLEVGNQIKMGSDAKISWGNVDDKPDVATTTDVTEITNNTIKTTNVLASNLQVNAAHIQGTLVIGQLPNTVAETSDIPTNISQLTNDSGYKNAEEVVTIAKGEISAAKIRANQVNVTDLNAFGATIGGWNININGILSGKFVGDESIITDKKISGMISANSDYYYTYEHDVIRIVQKYQSLVDGGESPIRFIAGSTPKYYEPDNSEPYISLTDNANFVVLEDGSLYASAADITGTIHATDGEFTGTVYATNGEFTGTINASDGYIGNLQIFDGGLKGISLKDDSDYSFLLDSNGLSIYNENAQILVGNLLLKHTKEKTIFSAQNVVSLQSGLSDDASAYIKFGGVQEGNSDNSNIADITLYAMATGDGIKQSVKFYAKSSKALPVIRYITFYYNTQVYNSYYPLSVKSYTLTIKSNEVMSDEYIVTQNSSIINNWIRFSKDRDEVEKSAVAGWGEIDSNITSELCMNTEGKVTSASIPFELFAWSSTNIDFLVNGNIVLDTGKTGNLGSGSSRWSAVFANSIDALTSTTSLAYTDSGTIDSSDKNIKKDIENLPDTYSILFDSLNPVRYKYIDNTSNRYHTGFIAQDVINAVKNIGLTSKDFAAYCEWDKDGELTCGLRYSEFIALCVNEIQKLKKRVIELENKERGKENG